MQHSTMQRLSEAFAPVKRVLTTRFWRVRETGPVMPFSNRADQESARMLAEFCEIGEQVPHGATRDALYADARTRGGKLVLLPATETPDFRTNVLNSCLVVGAVIISALTFFFWLKGNIDSVAATGGGRILFVIPQLTISYAAGSYARLWFDACGGIWKKLSCVYSWSVICIFATFSMSVWNMYG